MSTTTTPNALRIPILKSLGKLSAFKAGVAIHSKQVADAVIAAINVPDEKSIRSNINFSATQRLRVEGLIAPHTRKGWWALTEKGLALIQEGAPEVSASPPHRPETLYSEDCYILSVTIAQTRCFGMYLQGDRVCEACPIHTLCQDKLFEKLEALANNSISKTNPSPPIPSLSDVCDELEVAIGSEASNRHVGFDSTASVASRCYLCFQDIPENDPVTYVPTFGVRHRPHCPIMSII